VAGLSARFEPMALIGTSSRGVSGRAVRSGPPYQQQPSCLFKIEHRPPRVCIRGGRCLSARSRGGL